MVSQKWIVASILADINPMGWEATVPCGHPHLVLVAVADAADTLAGVTV